MGHLNIVFDHPSSVEKHHGIYKASDMLLSMSSAKVTQAFLTCLGSTFTAFRGRLINDHYSYSFASSSDKVYRDTGKKSP